MERDIPYFLEYKSRSPLILIHYLLGAATIRERIQMREQKTHKRRIRTNRPVCPRPTIFSVYRIMCTIADIDYGYEIISTTCRQFVQAVCIVVTPKRSSLKPDEVNMSFCLEICDNVNNLNAIVILIINFIKSALFCNHTLASTM